jgi:limonene-1,2-epoxide hydrolase
MTKIDITRRTAFVAGALGAFAAAGLTAKTAAAYVPTETQAANLKVVADFIAAWNTPDKAVTYLADDAAVRMVEDQPPVIGPAATTAAFKSFMGHGETIDVQILHSFTEGPVVTNIRVDTLKTPGKADQVFKVVGVFVVKKGKIKEWTDYLDV